MIYCYQKDGLWYDVKNLKPTFRHGNGSIIIKKSFSEKKVGNIYIINGKVGSLKYTTILKNAVCLNLKFFISTG